MANATGIGECAMSSSRITRHIGALVGTVLVASQSGCIFCMLEGTLVNTPSGPVAVEDLRPGQAVVCVSPSGEHEIGRVAGKKKATALLYLDIRLEGTGQRLSVTPQHPLATEDAWVSANRIKVGDFVRTQSGLTEVTEVTTRFRSATVYDISVSPYANFFANGVLVHNKSTPAPATAEDLPGVWIGHFGKVPQETSWWCPMGPARIDDGGPRISRFCAGNWAWETVTFPHTSSD